MGMAQPFRTETRFRSEVWPDFIMELREDHLAAETKTACATISSAVWGGGLQTARRFVNWQVPLAYRCDTPAECMRSKILEWGYALDDTVGMQTAANVRQASLQEMKGDQFSLICCATVGTSNAARAGTPRTTFSAYRPGTINIMLWIDALMTPAAMVNALLTATEAKSAALQDLQIRDETGRMATGTTTDSIVLATTQNKRYPSPHLFAGTATTIGNAIGRTVYRAVSEAAAGHAHSQTEMG